ncbi:unnamed protein product [Amoebophrya sp. A25]|nr:unnamed protein product [Amoebophrya sp. A25]|eukprot:GSA25T00011126001.1
MVRALLCHNFTCPVAFLLALLHLVGSYGLSVSVTSSSSSAALSAFGTQISTSLLDQNRRAARIFSRRASSSTSSTSTSSSRSRTALKKRGTKARANPEEPPLVYTEDASYLNQDVAEKPDGTSTEALTPAPFEGQYCRGGACQYRTPPPPKPVPDPGEPATAAIPPAFDAPDKREFCQGLGCNPGQGHPVSGAAAVFAENCAQLVDIEAGGLQNDPHTGGVRLKQAHANFLTWCGKRVAPTEAPSCADSYVDVLTMALSAQAKSPAIGATADVCSALGSFLGTARSADVHLRLIPEALPKTPDGTLMLASLQRLAETSTLLLSNDTSTTASTSNSAKSLHFPRTSDASLSLSSTSHSVVQHSSEVQNNQKVQKRGVWWREGKIPSYVASPPCASPVGVASPTKSYVIDAVSGAEVAGDLYEYCSDQTSEIFGPTGGPFTGAQIAEKTRSWCRWKASVRTFAGKPDWDSRTCNGMLARVAFALRYQLDAVLSPQQVCKALFSSQATVRRVQALVDNALAAPVRGASLPQGETAEEIAERKRVAEEAEAYARAVQKKLRDAAAAQAELEKIRMDKSAFTPGGGVQLR